MSLRRLSVATLVITVVTGAAATGTVEGPPLIRIDPSDGYRSDQFGATVDISDGRCVAGAPRDVIAVTGEGSAYVFELQPDGAWQEVAKLIASDHERDDYFGTSVAVSGDTIAVGSYRDDDGGDRTGSVYIYDRSPGGVWSETTKLHASDAAPLDEFGYAVDLEGDTLVAGAIKADAAYVFERDGTGTWTETAILTYAGSSADGFARAVATDGEAVLIGEFAGDDCMGGSGSTHVFEKDGTGSWMHVARLNAQDCSGPDHFGWSVEVNGDLAVVGAPSDDAPLMDSGSAYVFERQPDGVWQQVQKLVASNGSQSGSFGESVDTNGQHVFVGAPGAGDDGAIYVYKTGATGEWFELPHLQQEISNPDGRIGSAVAVDGGSLLAGVASGNRAYVGDVSAFLTIEPYGAGCPGEGGVVPELSIGGDPTPGGEITIGVENAVGGSVVFFLAGTDRLELPIGGGCYLNVAPFPPQVLGPFILQPIGGMGAGNGSLDLSAVVPGWAPSIVVDLQAAVPDAAAVKGYSTSNGIEFGIQ